MRPTHAVERDGGRWHVASFEPFQLQPASVALSRWCFANCGGTSEHTGEPAADGGLSHDAVPRYGRQITCGSISEAKDNPRQGGNSEHPRRGPGSQVPLLACTPTWVTST